MPNLPLPPELPSGRLFGHLSAFRADTLGLFTRAREEKGDIVRLRMAHRTLIFLYRPEHVQHVLVERMEAYSKQSMGFKVLRQVLREGLLTSEGELWRRQRRIANPAFQQRRIAGFTQTMIRDTEQMLDRWPTRGQLDMAEEMMRLTLRIAGETLFGVDLSASTSEVGQALGVVLGSFRAAVSNPLLLALPTPTRGAVRRATAVLDRVVHEIITARRAAGPESADDLLSMLMMARDEETGQGMSDAQLRDEVLTMILAGHETTANALTWTLYELARHPELAEAIAAEAAEGLGGADPAPEAFARLPRADRALREGMRLWPPAWVDARLCESDQELDGHRIPKDALIFLSFWELHRHPRYWVEPLRFDPDRWLPERSVCPDGSPRPRLAWAAFGAGQRKCIGEHFAMLEARVVLSLVLRRFALSAKACPDPIPEPSVTLRPRDGLHLQVQARSRS